MTELTRARYRAETDLNQKLILKRLRDLSLENLVLVDRNEKLQAALDASIAREARRALHDDAAKHVAWARLVRSRDELLA